MSDRMIAVLAVTFSLAAGAGCTGGRGTACRVTQDCAKELICDPIFLVCSPPSQTPGAMDLSGVDLNPGGGGDEDGGDGGSSDGGADGASDMPDLPGGDLLAPVREPWHATDASKSTPGPRHSVPAR